MIFINKSPKPTKIFKLEELVLKTIKALPVTDEITKTGNLATKFHKYAGEENPYVRFGYVPLKIF